MARPTAAQLLFALSLLALSAPAEGGFDELSDERVPPSFGIDAGGMRLVFKGEAELELHDIEGRGGLGFDSPTDTRTIGTRSPFIELDSFWLGLRLASGEHFRANTLLELNPRGAVTRAVWMEWRFSAWANHRLELGFQQPFIAIDRRTERYPLIASAYWREPEFHATYEARVAVTSSTAIELGVSAAMMRPLGFSGVQESESQSGTIRILAYRPARVFSGNAPVLGSKLRLASHGAFVEVFGFIGSLAAEAGTNELRNNFAAIGARDLSTTFRWGGARLGADAAGAHLVLEAIASEESVLRRHGAYAQLSYAFALGGSTFHTVEPLLRYEIYRIRPADLELRFRSTAPAEAVTWDFDVTTLALIVGVYQHLLRLRLELYLIAEHNGTPRLAIVDAPFRNNEFLAQLELRF